VAVRWVLAGGLLAIVVAFTVLLSHSEPRRSGSDLTPNANFAAMLSAGQQTCQDQELLPADTAALRMTIGTYGKPGPRLSVSLTGPHGEPLTTGGLAAGWRQGVVEIPVAHVSAATAEARVCLRDDGPSRVALAGDSGDQFHEMQVAGKKVENARLLYEYMRPGSESWLQLLPTAVYRFSLGKSDLVRHWAWVGALVLMLLAVALVMRTILREGARA
jgi:hypothetical protein